LGSIGQRHAVILKNDFSHEVYAFRSGKTAKGNPLGIKEVISWADVEKLHPDVAFITNPTSEHVSTALACAQRGINLFIEKPLSDRLQGVDELIGLCQQKHLTAYVGYCLRFHPVIEKIAELLKGKTVESAAVICSSMLSQWRPQRDPKDTYSAHQAMGGGVILDLSHEFDYIHFLFGGIRSIQGRKGRRGNVTVDSEDFADTQITLNNSVRVDCRLNFASLDLERTIAIKLRDGFIKGDLIQNSVSYREGDKSQLYKFVIERDEYFKKQTEYFFNNLNNPKLMNNLSEAKILLEKILEFRHGK